MFDYKTLLKHQVGQSLGHAQKVFRSQKADTLPLPIKLYWWNERANFGDLLSPIIVEHLSGRPVEWASLDECNMCSIGSIYGWLRQRSRRYLRDVHVWGSGIMKPVEAVGSLEGLHHHLVRGPLTCMAAEDKNLPTGDPGLLVDEVFEMSQATDAKGVGIVPHRSQWSKEEYIKDLKSIPGVRLIDYRTEDCQACMEEMASCEIIFSSSLHGLVVADSLEIPNYWFQGVDMDAVTHPFKFFDYGLSIGRNLPEAIELRDSPALKGKVAKAEFAYFKNLPRKKAEIRNSFPLHIFGDPQPT